jgi:hypothetical protein
MPEGIVLHPLLVYTDSFRWAGDLALAPALRLSDFLNEPSNAYLTLDSVTLSAWDQGAIRELTKIDVTAIVKANIIAILSGPDAPVPPRNEAERVQKVPQRMMVYAPPFAVVGNLHHVPSSTWLDTLRAMRHDYVTLTNVNVWSFDPRSAVNQAAPFAMVNRRWIAALHPLGQPDKAKAEAAQAVPRQSWSRLRDLGGGEPSKGDRTR